MGGLVEFLLKARPEHRGIVGIERHHQSSLQEFRQRVVLESRDQAMAYAEKHGFDADAFLLLQMAGLSKWMLVAALTG